MTLIELMNRLQEIYTAEAGNGELPIDVWIKQAGHPGNPARHSPVLEVEFIPDPIYPTVYLKFADERSELPRRANDPASVRERLEKEWRQ